jgi:hypothetical protein
MTSSGGITSFCCFMCLPTTKAAISTRFDGIGNTMMAIACFLGKFQVPIDVPVYFGGFIEETAVNGHFLPDILRIAGELLWYFRSFGRPHAMQLRIPFVMP